ncbi:MAG TPA: HEAT repeat domain-containing protein [Gemmatimonadales bacterium]|nr:HEAT repeat domain-containing protein [Gemmatimonadales bacterium]
MATFETIADRFARCVDLFRDPDAKAAQKAEFRVLVELLKDVAVTLRADAGGLAVNGVPCEGQTLLGLLQRLELHGVAEIALPQAPPPAQLFELFKALADQPGAEELPSRLRAAGVDRIRVTEAGAVPPPDAPAANAGNVNAAASVTPSPEVVARRSGALGTKGILRGEAMRDIESVPLAGVPLVTHDPPVPPAAQALPGAAAREAAKEPAASAPPSPAAQGPPPFVGGAGPAAPADDAGGEGDPLAQLERNPAAANVGDVLAALVERAEAAVKANRAEQVLAVVVAIARTEQRLPAASNARRIYGIAVRRICTKRVIQTLARLLTAPKHRSDATLALQRAGADAVEVLFDMLVAAPGMSERRAVFDALSQMKHGTEQLIAMLDHSEWFVVRNVAELLGELGMEDAVPALGRQLGHADERVRKAVALGLAKIGTRSAAEPLRRALRDKSADVRMQVALGIGGRKSSALAMPLVVAMEEEKDEAVERELILALGRIGSADAVQALIKFAQPSGRIFGRKPTELRLAAVEALRLAASPAAVGTLEGLADDGDKQVRAAARDALTDLKRKPSG